MYASFYAIPTIASPMRRRCFSTTDFLALRLLPPALLFNHCLPPKLLFNLLIILPPCFLALAAAAALLLFQFHPCFSSIITIAALPPPQYPCFSSIITIAALPPPQLVFHCKNLDDAAAAPLLFQFHPCFSSIITIAALPPPQ